MISYVTYDIRLSSTSRIIPLVPSQALRDGKYYGGMDVSGLLSVTGVHVAQLDWPAILILMDNLLLLPNFCPHLELPAELSGWQTWNITFIGAVIYWLASDRPLVLRLS